MANTIAKFIIRTTVQPKEKVISTTLSGKMSALNPSGFYLNGSTELWTPSSTSSTVDCTIIDDTTPAGSDEDGYLAGRRVFVKGDTSTPAASMSGLSNVEMVWIKHSGFGYSRTVDATCDTTNTSTVVTCDSTTSHHAGQWVTGSGIPNETYITSILSSTTFNLSSAATATATNETLTTSGINATANTIDHLEVRSTSGSGAIITVLGPGEGIFLHPQGHTDSGDYFFQSVDPGDLSNGAADIAIEFICVVAS